MHHTTLALVCQSTPIHEQLTTCFPAKSPYEAAAIAVSDVVALRYLYAFAYDCTINPEGISDSELAANLQHAEGLMFSALSRLDDDDVQSILASHQDTDLDGSRFSVATLEDVRRLATVTA
jgi:hypothetical protein